MKPASTRNFYGMWSKSSARPERTHTHTHTLLFLFILQLKLRRRFLIKVPQVFAGLELQIADSGH